jgi:hypothetical protein
MTFAQKVRATSASGKFTTNNLGESTESCINSLISFTTSNLSSGFFLFLNPSQEQAEDF